MDPIFDIPQMSLQAITRQQKAEKNYCELENVKVPKWNFLNYS